MVAITSASWFQCQTVFTATKVSPFTCAGPSADDSLGYDWAIVSGGPPKVETDGGCRTGSEFLQRFRVNGVGLWLFSRKPVDPANTQIMRAKAESLGFDLSVLLPVAQEGCEYNGAR